MGTKCKWQTLTTIILDGLAFLGQKFAKICNLQKYNITQKEANQNHHSFFFFKFEAISGRKGQ